MIDGEQNVQTVDSNPEEFTPAEKAYFESRGQVTDGLFGDGDGDSSQSDKTPASDAQNGADKQAADEPPSDPLEKEAIDPDHLQLDDKGMVRDKRTNKWVPHQKMHRELMRRRAAEGELSKVREELAGLREKATIFETYVKEAATTGDKKPGQTQEAAADPWAEPDVDPNEDVFKALDQQKRRSAWLVKQLQETRQDGTKTQAVIEASAAQSWVKSDMESFARKQADFLDAYNFLHGAITREYELRGVADPTQREKMVAQEAKSLAMEMRKAGKSFAGTVYEMAKLRGYQPKQPATATTTTTNGGDKSEPDELTKKIEALTKGQQAARSLSSVGGAPSQGLTLDEYLAMSPEQSSSLEAQLGSSGMRRLMKSWGHA